MSQDLNQTTALTEEAQKIVGSVEGVRSALYLYRSTEELGQASIRGARKRINEASSDIHRKREEEILGNLEGFAKVQLEEARLKLQIALTEYKLRLQG
ncbi:MAG: hypothetical protein A3B96_03695 [Candidatus Spechtbacteria bacterium RIFCSPHIGHO2_02_FULL_43_15b]|uniref:Uncharacterized protein n=1 Tax=Candidatus Spechtbacteria bacterium RIFCSPHIGHO2_01_FULL_43_30 TaxID=1802158 RepID=A0A1G2H9M1_9BACT|nr:MAG: hypothetical protein A2827_03215 [Candidatus Spechtbacteria bacterium RIFCSPHIGHO2_01_FULL_43_30]OGZ59114.1 MAG: hypothetical protein A3B96_03695 [Candidatus Spechtbacteria bacterium RIFCSPHIGHO2_02_FULL_43_15b]